MHSISHSVSAFYIYLDSWLHYFLNSFIFFNLYIQNYLSCIATRRAMEFALMRRVTSRIPAPSWRLRWVSVAQFQAQLQKQRELVWPVFRRAKIIELMFAGNARLLLVHRTRWRALHDYLHRRWEWLPRRGRTYSHTAAREPGRCCRSPPILQIIDNWPARIIFNWI